MSEKDGHHIERLKSFVEYSGFAKDTAWSCLDRDIIPTLCAKFGIVPLKTYNPPSLDLGELPRDLRLSLFAGIVDADGSITNPQGRMGILRIKLHRSWEHFLTDLLGLILKDTNSCCTLSSGIQEDKYFEVMVSDSETLKTIRREVEDLNLPTLTRKWDRIDLDYLGRSEKLKRDTPIIMKLLREGLSQREISEKVGRSESGISQIINSKGGV